MDKTFALANFDQVLKLITDSVQYGVNVTKEQLPLFLQEVVRFAIAKHIAFLVIGVILLVLTLIFFFVIKKALEGDFASGVEYLVLGVGGMVSVGMIMYNTYMLLEAYYAPRLYLFWAIKSLLGLGAGS